MKKIIFIWTLLIIISFPSFARAEEKVDSNVKVSQFVIAIAVNDLTPVDVSESFPHTVSKLYAFCQLTNAGNVMNILHKWYFGDKLMAEVKLPVPAASWRTYSSKNILPLWTGEWKVDITTEDGLLLDSLTFFIEKDA